MKPELHEIACRLEQARAPEEVFGELAGPPEVQLAGLREAYRRLAKIAHPDACSAREDQEAAQAAFSRLSDWYTSAQARIRAGVYGSASPLDGWRVALRAGRRSYILENTFHQGAVCTCYPAVCQEGGRSREVTLKITRDPQDNDLAENEARALRALESGKAARRFGSYLPSLLDSFTYEEGGVYRQVNVFERSAGWYTLAQVRRGYPGGLEPKEVSWIWRRVLVALGFAHLNGRVCGAALPACIEILPGLHGLRLAEWSYSALLADPRGGAPGESLPALDPAYEQWYPEEALRGEPALPGTDIGMAARCMIDLLGGDPVRGWLPASVPEPLRAFFRGCILPGRRAPQDAWALKAEFEDLIQRMWGRLPFHPFIFNPINQ